MFAYELNAYQHLHEKQFIGWGRTLESIRSILPNPTRTGSTKSKVEPMAMGVYFPRVTIQEA